MKRTSKQLVTCFVCLAIPYFFVGCGLLNDNKKGLQSNKEGVSEINDSESSSIVSFHEVYRLSDKKLIQVLKAIPEIDGFIPIYVLDYQNYPQNVAGVTDREENKKRIMDELTKIDSILENSFFCWSKKKQQNRITNEELYHLYLLKKLDEESRIENDEISKAEVAFNEFANEPEIRIRFNKSGAAKWSKMTEKAALDNNGFIAIVVDSEVYSCPYMVTPIYSGEVAFFGFDDKYEAEKIVGRIKAMKSQ
jgi:hypothetical protein